MELEREQQELLTNMVDGARRVPRPEQRWRLGGEHQPENVLSGPWGDAASGSRRLRGGRRSVLVSDVSALHQAGFLKAVSLNYVYGNVYVITAEGYAYVDALRARIASPVDDQPTGWEAVDAALDRLKRLVVDATDMHDFKGVGHQAVTVLEVVGRTAFDAERHLPDGEPMPAPNDVKRRIDLIIDSSTGKRFEHVRQILRGAQAQAQAVKHRNEPNGVDAGIAADAVILLVAIVRRLVNEDAASVE